MIASIMMIYTVVASAAIVTVLVIVIYKEIVEIKDKMNMTGIVLMIASMILILLVLLG